MTKPNKFTVLCSPDDETFHNIFVTGDWDLEKLTNFFGSIETILSNVLHRRSCPVEVVRLLVRHGANVNCQDKFGQSPLTIAVGLRQDKAVIRELLEAGADINIGEKGESLLIYYLGRFFSNNCDIGVVQLLLSYDTNINAVNASGNTPIMIALQCSRGKAIIQTLLEKGARVDTVNRIGKSPLCIAFHHCSCDIVKLLTDAGAPPNACTYHKSLFHCALDCPGSDLREDILKYLLEGNMDLNSRDEYGQSVLCFALHYGAKANNIQLLLNLGASLNACRMHSSALICATSSNYFTPIKKDVIKVLLDNGASINNKGLKVLQHALYFREYETGAIQLLLNLPGMDEYISTHKSILHVALRGPGCKLDTVILLINHNVQVNSVDEMRNTPLHIACRFKCAIPSIIKVLLKKSSQVNAKNNREETPLMLAVRNKQCHVDTLKELLFHGALIGSTKFRISENAECDLLELLAHEWERNPANSDKLINYKMLLKFFLLQNPDFTFENVQHDPVIASYDTINLEIFFNECLSELEKFDVFLVCHGYTFRMIVEQDIYLETIYNYNLSLFFLSKNSFPIYFDVISARFHRSFMEAQVYKLRVYTNKTYPVEQVILDNDVVLKIAKYLADDDLLKFILASYLPVQLNEIDRESTVDSVQPGKRKCRAITKRSKRRKL